MVFDTLFWLITLHFLSDYQLQTDFIARNKAPGSSPHWPGVLTAHSACHGAAVGLVLSPVWGVAEAISHWIIDYSKSKNLLGDGSSGIWIDQSLHIGLKFVWLIGFLKLDAVF